MAGPSSSNTNTTASTAYLCLSSLLACALLGLARAADTDTALGLFAYTPLFALLHHAFVLATHLRARAPSATPLSLGPEHAPLLRLLAGIYILGALLAAVLARALTRELAGTPCDAARLAYCHALGARLGATALAAVLGAGAAVVLALLLRTVRRAEGAVVLGEDGEEEEEYEGEKWSMLGWSRRAESQVCRVPRCGGG